MPSTPLLAFTRRSKDGQSLLKVKLPQQPAAHVDGRQKHRRKPSSQRPHESTSGDRDLEANRELEGLQAILQRACDDNPSANISFEVHASSATVKWKPLSAESVFSSFEAIEKVLVDAAAEQRKLREMSLAAAELEAQVAKAAAIAAAEAASKRPPTIPAGVLAMGDIVHPCECLKWPVQTVGRLVGRGGAVIRKLMDDLDVQIGIDDRQKGMLRVKARNQADLRTAVTALSKWRDERLQPFSNAAFKRTLMLPKPVTVRKEVTTVYAPASRGRAAGSDADDANDGGGSGSGVPMGVEIETFTPYAFGPITGEAGATKHKIQDTYGVDLEFDVPHSRVEIRGAKQCDIDDAMMVVRLCMRWGRRSTAKILEKARFDSVHDCAAAGAETSVLAIDPYTVEAGETLVSRILSVPSIVQEHHLARIRHNLCRRGLGIVYTVLFDPAPDDSGGTASYSSLIRTAIAIETPPSTVASSASASAAAGAGAGAPESAAAATARMLLLLAADDDVVLDAFQNQIDENVDSWASAGQSSKAQAYQIGKQRGPSGPSKTVQQRVESTPKVIDELTGLLLEIESSGHFGYVSKPPLSTWYQETWRSTMGFALSTFAREAALRTGRFEMGKKGVIRLRMDSAGVQAFIKLRSRASQ